MKDMKKMQEKIMKENYPNNTVAGPAKPINKIEFCKGIKKIKY